MSEMNSCPVCSGPIRGRQDKKFCSAVCRGAFHYEKRKMTASYFSKIEKQIKLNRKLLRLYKRRGKHFILKKRLMRKGFSSAHYTHVIKSEVGGEYFFCFDFGYCKLNSGPNPRYFIVSWKEIKRQKKSPKPKR